MVPVIDFEVTRNESSCTLRAKSDLALAWAAKNLAAAVQGEIVLALEAADTVIRAIVADGLIAVANEHIIAYSAPTGFVLGPRVGVAPV
jgi:hypothetical protein